MSNPYREITQALDDLVKSRFVEMFDDLETCPLSEYVDNFSGGKSLAGSEECENKVLNTGSVTFGYFNPNDVKNLPSDYAPNPDHLVKKGDLLISRMNTPALVGAVAYVNVDVKNTYMPDRLWKAHYKSNSNPIYLWQSLLSDKAKRQIIASATGTSGTMKNITKQKMMSIRIPKAPLDLQNHFASFYEKIDKSKLIAQQAAEKYDQLVKSRFIEMFGDIRTNSKSFPTITFGDYTKQMNIGPFGSDLKNDCFVPEGEGYCMVYEQKHAIDKDFTVEKRYVNKEKYEQLKRFDVGPGDILVSCRGTIGKCVLLPETAEHGVIHPSLMMIKPKDDVNHAFLLMLLEKILDTQNEKGSGVKMAIKATELSKIETIKQLLQI